MIEWTLGLPLDGFDSSKLIKCNDFEAGCWDMPLNKAPFGRRPASIEIDLNFLPQIFTCNVCQDKRDEFQVYFLQNQCLYSDIYIIYSWYKFTDPRGAVLNLVTRCHCRGKTTSKLNLKSAWETNIYWKVWNKRRHQTLWKFRCDLWWWWCLWYGFHVRLPNVNTIIRILWMSHSEFDSKLT